MAVWVIRAGRMGENEEFALKNGVHSIGFGLRRKVTDFANYEELRDHLQTEGMSVQQAAAPASQLWRFAHTMRVGEMVVLPRKRPKVIAVGRIAGDYEYSPDETQAPLPHTRRVEWTVADVPRANFALDLLRSFNSNRTIFEANRNNAEARIRQVVDAYLVMDKQ